MDHQLKLKNYGRLFFTALVMLVWASSCKVEKIAPVDEAAKDISGSWKVIKATRNGTDLTSIVDFSQFRVKFDAAGNYTLVNKLPFLVSKDGAYSLDNPQYPFKITFTATGGQAIVTSFNYPIIGGVRQLNLTFSPGCTLNSYVYTFVKE